MTPEQAIRIRNSPAFEDCNNEELSKCIDDALEKQIAKKPQYHENECCYACKCGRVLFAIGDYYHKEFCDRCGQKIDWS